jgi:hypothetical protein
MRYTSLKCHFLVDKEELVVLSDHMIELRKDDVTHVSCRVEYWEKRK